MVRERDRSIFTPTATPRPLAPTIRMNPGQTTKQIEGRVPSPEERKQILEHSVMPGQFKGRPSIDPDAIKSATPPPAPKPQIAPPPQAPAPVMHERPQVPERPVMPNQFRGRPNIDPEAVKAPPPPAPKPQVAPPPPPPPQAPAPVMHERPQVPEHPVMPNQFRGRPNIDPEAVKAAPPPPPPRPQIVPPPQPVPRPQQIAPPPLPAPAQGQPGHNIDPEVLKRLKKQQEEANKKD